MIIDLQAHKDGSKIKMIDLADINNVYQFEVEVQQNMCNKVSNIIYG